MWNILRLVSKGAYIYAVVPNHPFATKHGYVLYHRIVVENHTGKMLTQKEIVHHIDGDKRNNDISNLEVMSLAEHASHHGKEKGYLLCDIRCPACNTIFTRRRNKTHLAKPNSKLQVTCCSDSCRGKFSREVQIKGKTNSIEERIMRNIVKIYRGYK